MVFFLIQWQQLGALLPLPFAEPGWGGVVLSTRGGVGRKDFVCGWRHRERWFVAGASRRRGISLASSPLEGTRDLPWFSCVTSRGKLEVAVLHDGCLGEPTSLPRVSAWHVSVQACPTAASSLQWTLLHLGIPLLLPSSDLSPGAHLHLLPRDALAQWESVVGQGTCCCRVPGSWSPLSLAALGSTC